MSMAAVIPETLHYAPPHLALDLWRPQVVPVGLVVHAHGGGFVHGGRDDRIARHYGPLLAAQGFAFASISYRKGGAPRRAFDEAMLVRIAAASDRSLAFYPGVRPSLFGPALYRAAVDFGNAVRFLQATGFGGLPWIAMGNSSGGLAAIGMAHGLDGLTTEPVPTAPAKVLALACLAPQPWMLQPDGPPVALLTARGDQVFPRRDIDSLEAHAKENALPLQIARIPYGQHTRPVREVLPAAEKTKGLWSDWLMQQLLGEFRHPRAPRQGQT